MRRVCTLAIVLFVAAPLGAQKRDEGPAVRFGIEPDLDAYPQSKPKEALQSVFKAADAGRFTYLVAQLTDPAFVDKRVKEAGSFDKFVGIVKDKWTNDPEMVKQLRRFASEGEWQEGGDVATAKLKDVPTRQVFLKKTGNRWFLENRTKAEP